MCKAKVSPPTCCLVLLCLAVTVNSAPAESDVMLLQVRHAAKLVKKHASDPLHAHLVCHSDGCEEVQAKMVVVANRTKAAKAALEECGTHRAKLVEELGKAAAARGKAEAELAQCGKDRAKLAEELAQCGKDRGEAEAALAGCARERGQLEEKLQQCAEVDRPAAEAALQKCGKERAELEKKLQALAEKAKGGGGIGKGGSGKGESDEASRRRRRKKSLAQVDVEVQEADGEAEHTQFAEEMRVRQRLTELREEEDDILARFEAFNKLIETIKGDLDKSDMKFLKAVGAIQALAKKEEGVLDKTASMAERLEKARDVLEKAENWVNQVKADLVKSEASVQEATTSVVTESGNSAAVVAELLQLNMEMHDLRAQEATLARDDHEREVTALQEKLAAQLARDDDHEECDETRAQLVLAGGKLKEAQEALGKCLDAKKVITAKIAAVEKAKAEAEAGLAKCLATKAKLKAAVEECHKRRDTARAKLKDCLDRKKVLNEKIAACHAAKAAAKKKLQECLSRKEELKQRIMKLMKGAALVESGEVDANLGFAAVIEELRTHLRQEGDVMTDLAAAEHTETEGMVRVIAEVVSESEGDNDAVAALVEAGESETEATQASNELATQLSAVSDFMREMGALEDEAKAAGAASVQIAQR